MPLTPEDVHKKTFTPVRLREGYDMGEVDQFLDEVEVELTRLYGENEDLRAKLATAQTAAPGVPAPAPVAATPEPEAVAPPPEPEPAPAVVPALPAVSTVPEASSAAARLLEIATKNADQLVAEAQNEADKILSEAQIKSERLESDAKTKAD